jgi:hypothetical protein
MPHRRPGYAALSRRRREFVRRHLKDHGTHVGDGLWQAQCCVCSRTLTLPMREWWADHITPVAMGGREDGPLQLSCGDCQRKQGSVIGNARNWTHQRKREPEKHPGVVD